MNYISNILLLCMLLCYSIPILTIYFLYKNNNSISNIICDSKCQSIIFDSMIAMGIFTIFYELERGSIVSLILIILLLFGIYGVITINEKNKLHYLFAFIVFISILIFMIYHCYMTKSTVLFILLLIQLLFLTITIININKDIFYCEILYIVNFGLYYLVLHQI